MNFYRHAKLLFLRSLISLQMTFVKMVTTRSVRCRYCGLKSSDYHHYRAYVQCHRMCGAVFVILRYLA